MKIAFVVQRCGQNIFAGAEVLVLQLGTKLSEIFDIEVLTTTAKDASNWKNFYSEGTEKIGKLTIRRFLVDKERNPEFVPMSIYLETHNDDEQKGLDFINANGPISTKLIN
ncbi:MAG: hypothetical protein KGL95_06865 [Patescibacteria group bacterium]|nr:hypothetical protein [Patescibacteria group bacterium]